MTQTETIVRLLKSALAGEAGIGCDYDFDQIGHCDVPVTIDDILINFWIRDSLRRVSDVTFPDGATIDSRELTAERWLPPRDEFGDWYHHMNGFECATVDDMIAESDRQYEELRAANAANDDSAAALVRVCESYDRYIDAHRRIMDGFNPFSYLSQEEQTRFEELLKKQKPGAAA